MEGKHFIVSRRYGWHTRNRLSIATWLLSLIALLMLWLALISAGTQGKRAEASSLSLFNSPLTLSPLLAPVSAAADPDLCALLPSGGGWAVGTRGGATVDCSARKTGATGVYANVEDAAITKYASIDAAHQALQIEHNSIAGGTAYKVNPTTDVGDPGYAYYTEPQGDFHPGGFFARGCYYVIVSGSLPPASTSDMRALLVSIDTALKQAPCGGGGGANPTAVPTPVGHLAHAIVTGVSTGWFGDPAVILRADGSWDKLETGSVIYEGDNIISNNSNITLNWEVSQAEVKIGPEALVTARTHNPNPKPNPFAQVYPSLEVQAGEVRYKSYSGGKERLAQPYIQTLSLGCGSAATEYIVGYNSKTQVTTVQVIQDTVAITPTNSALLPFHLQAGQQVTVDPRSVSPITSYVPIPGDAGRIFPETNKAVTGIFLDYWFQHGGLAQQGYPITEQFQEKSDLDGKTYAVQYFERAVFEYHPEFAAPNDVLLSQLGTFQYKRKYPNGAPNQHADQTNGNFFSQTGHWVGGKFWQYWQTHGGLAQQGYPLSDEFTEVSETDGKPYTVQYFERAVFEQHPEFAPPNDVLLSLLGVFFNKQKYGEGGGGGGTTQPTATPVSGSGGGGSGQCSNIPAPINMTITPTTCAAAGTPFYFVGSGFQPRETVTVYVTAPDGSVLGATFQVTADQNGVTSGASGVTLTTQTNTTPGVYSLTMEGVTSHIKAIGYIRVLAP